MERLHEKKNKTEKNKTSEISDLSFEETFYASRVVKINDSTAVCKTLNHQRWKKKTKTKHILAYGSGGRSDGPKLESAGASGQSPSLRNKVHQTNEKQR